MNHNYEISSCPRSHGSDTALSLPISSNVLVVLSATTADDLVTRDSSVRKKNDTTAMTQPHTSPPSVHGLAPSYSGTHVQKGNRQHQWAMTRTKAMINAEARSKTFPEKPMFPFLRKSEQTFRNRTDSHWMGTWLTPKRGFGK